MVLLEWLWCCTSGITSAEQYFLHRYYHASCFPSISPSVSLHSVLFEVPSSREAAFAGMHFLQTFPESKLYTNTQTAQDQRTWTLSSSAAVLFLCIAFFSFLNLNDTHASLCALAAFFSPCDPDWQASHLKRMTTTILQKKIETWCWPQNWTVLDGETGVFSAVSLPCAT